MPLICLILLTQCKQSIENNKDFDKSQISFKIENLDIEKVEQSDVDLERITFAQKVAEIYEDISEEDIFFVKVSDICVTRENHVFVADSRLCKIFKFDNQFNYLNSFGQQGQGPGDLLGDLKINVGNDNKLYITDNNSYRLIVYSLDGQFLDQFSLPGKAYDKIVANSKGEIYILSPSGFKIIDCYDSSFNYQDSMLDMNYQVCFFYEKPSIRIFGRISSRLTAMEIHKFLSKDDNLFVVFNNSQAVVQLDQNNKVVNRFRVEHPRFVEDYKRRLKVASKNGAWINCFGSVFLDNKGLICLCYYNESLKIPEVYRYRKDGKFVDTVRFKNIFRQSNAMLFSCDSSGNYYGVDNNSSIAVYRIMDVL